MIFFFIVCFFITPPSVRTSSNTSGCSTIVVSSIGRDLLGRSTSIFSYCSSSVLFTSRLSNRSITSSVSSFVLMTLTFFFFGLVSSFICSNDGVCSSITVIVVSAGLSSSCTVTISICSSF
uniref:Secreted protein n=1 Tax=Anopheles darlingi TaxID=43151 RepID=A0A2M4DD71_ANODA